MSDQETHAEAPTEDTPNDAHTEEQAVNWQQRYESLQPEYTRASQEAAQHRQLVEGLKNGDPEAFQALGLEFADREDTTPDDGLEDPYDQRLAALEQRLEEQQTASQQQQQLAAVEQHVEKELGALEGLDESDRDLVVRLAVAMDPTENGMPDVKGAFDSLRSRDSEAQKRWAGTKRAPRVSPTGQAGTQQPDISEMTSSQRREFMAQRLQALED